MRTLIDIFGILRFKRETIVSVANNPRSTISSIIIVAFVSVLTLAYFNRGRVNVTPYMIYVAEHPFTVFHFAPFSVIYGLARLFLFSLIIWGLSQLFCKTKTKYIQWVRVIGYTAVLGLIRFLPICLAFILYYKRSAQSVQLIFNASHIIKYIQYGLIIYWLILLIYIWKALHANKNG